MAKKKEVQKQAQNQVRIRILPLHGIGGVGNAGDTAWMDKKEAEQYEKDGYLEILPDADEPVPSTAEKQMELEEVEKELEKAEEDVAEDHEIMKPESKRK